MARPKKPKYRPKQTLVEHKTLPYPSSRTWEKRYEELRKPLQEPKFPKYMWSTRPDLTFVVTGSRDLADPLAAHEVMAKAFDAIPDDDTVLIVHGGAVGIDKMADLDARGRGWSVNVYRPDYKSFSRHYAPLKRNEKMVDLKPDAVLAFWNGKSRGTKYTIDYAKKKGIPVIIHRLEMEAPESYEDEGPLDYEMYTTKPLNLRDLEKTMKDVYVQTMKDVYVQTYKSKDLKIDF
jgi:hypothetical protein